MKLLLFHHLAAALGDAPTCPTSWARTAIGLALVLVGSFLAYRKLRIEKDRVIHQLEQEIERLRGDSR